MSKGKRENTKEKSNTYQEEQEFLEQHDIETDLEETDLEMNTRFQAF
ncbi:MAG: hypothetical protein PUC12_09590 [Clostridiales bacterium]|nr:hypothetical protein [Clostridiales bacterium]